MASIPPIEEIERLLRTFSRALHPRELASRLGIFPEDYDDLIVSLEKLEEQGRLKQLPGGRVRAAAVPNIERRPSRGHSKSDQAPSFVPRSKSVTGTLSVHPKGFGFVTSPDHDDIFIPPDAVCEALHQDKVTVLVTGKSPKGYEGRITDVVERRDRRVAGVLRKKRKSCWLEPDDSRLRGPIVVTQAEGAQDGDAAVVEIHTFPHFADELPEARLLEVLGPQGDPQTEVRKILLRESVREEHSPEALHNAEQMATRLGGYRLGKRRDLRHVPLPTIDPEDARDHDDALWVERSKTGYRAYIAIADVSEYVRPESALDEEARARGCTIYLPDRAIPMLPRALAGDLCSLLPEQDRFCMCVIAELNKNAEVQKFEIVEGLMRSQAKLTYGGVARTLGFDPESPQSPQAEAMKKDLAVLAELSQKLRKNRMKRGALDLDLPEARVVIDEESGAPTEVKRRATREGMKRAYNLVEEMMLLANELVAQWLNEKNAPAIYRVHGKPDGEKLERLAKIGEKLGLRVDVDELSQPLGAAKFLRSIQNHEKKPVLEMLLLRSLKQAVYDTQNVGHFGLASERYVHFTSPIRRYPDLRVHRQIKHILRGGKIDRSDEAAEDMQAAAVESSKKERSAMEIEREVMDLYRTVYMQRHIGDVLNGRVTGMSGTGLYLSVDDPCVDVLVPFEALGPDHYDTDEDELGVVGARSGEHIMFGDTLEVVVTDAVIERRTVFAARQREVHDEDDFFAEPFTEDDISTRAPKPRTGVLPRGSSRQVFSSSATELRLKKRGYKKRGRSADDSDGRAAKGRGKSFKPAAGSARSGGKKTTADRPGSRSSSGRASSSRSTSSRATSSGRASAPARSGGSSTRSSSKKTSSSRRKTSTRRR